MHSQIVVNPRFHGGTKIGRGGPVLTAKIGPGGPVLTADRFFRYSTYEGTYHTRIRIWYNHIRVWYGLLYHTRMVHMRHHWCI